MGGDHKPVTALKDSGLLVKEMLIKGWDPEKDYHELQKEKMCDIVFQRLFSYDPDGLGELEFEFNKAVPIAKLDKMTPRLKKACPTASIWVRRFAKPEGGLAPSMPAVTQRRSVNELQWKTSGNTGTSDLQWKTPAKEVPRRPPVQQRRDSELQWKTRPRGSCNELQWKNSSSPPVRASQPPTTRRKKSSGNSELIWRTDSAPKNVNTTNTSKIFRNRSAGSLDKPKKKKSKKASYVSIITPQAKPEANPFGILIPKMAPKKGKKLTVVKINKRKVSTKPVGKPRLIVPNAVTKPISRLRPSQIVERKMREERAAQERERKRIIARARRQRYASYSSGRSSGAGVDVPWYDADDSLAAREQSSMQTDYPSARATIDKNSRMRTNNYSNQAFERKLQQRQKRERKRQRVSTGSSSEYEYNDEMPLGPPPTKEELRRRKNRCEKQEEESQKNISSVINAKFAALERVAGPGKKRRKVREPKNKSNKELKPHIMGADIEPVNSVAGGCFKIKPRKVAASGSSAAMSLDNILDNLF